MGGRTVQAIDEPVNLVPDPVANSPGLPALGLALSAAAALAACGGGDNGLDGPFARSAEASTQRHILGVDAAAASASASPVPSESELMDWAELAYPQYFPTHQTDLQSAPYVYRYYAGTANYIGVAGGMVYVLGPVAGSAEVPAAVGTLAEFAPRVFARRAPASDADAARFLAQATLGFTDSDIADVRSLGYVGWLSREFVKPVSPGNWDWLEGKGIDQNLDNRNSGVGVDAQVWQRLIGASDGLRQRVALALSEIFVVGLDGITGPWKQFQLANWWDLLANGAFGTYRSLLEAVTLNPGMGVYLNMAGSQKENTATGRMPDENYAREVMQLFSIGLYALNPDGSVQRDATGKAVESYTQDTVSQLARVFTGWAVDARRGDTTPEQARRPMVLNASLHSTLQAKFLGTTVPVNTDGNTALRMALDTLANHPNVGPFLGRQLIQKLVTSNPSAPYVARVAAAFANNGAGVRGDLSAVVRAVLTDEEARSAAGLTDPQFGKLREPVLRFVQWARTFKASSLSTNWTIGNLSDPATRLGQSPLRSPSVFNFFRPGYVPAGTPIASAALVAPEFQLANESTVAGYLNTMQTVVASGNADLKPDYSAELALAADPAALVDRVEKLLCARQLQADTRGTIVNAVSSINAGTATGRNNRVYTAVLLVMACPEYLIQR